MRKISILFTILISAMLLSCTSQRRVAYFRDVDVSSAAHINQAMSEIHEARIAVGDMLSIVVSGLDPVTVAPFNLPLVSHEAPGSERVQHMTMLQAYVVDINGDIMFPVVGAIHLAGLTRMQAVERIKQKLEPHLKNIVVTIRFLNFRVSVLGEVARPGVFVVNNERITILEALALAGDMTIFGRRHNVLIIRENQGELEFARLNLNSDEIFTSPFFFLQQNDVIYVEPNNARAIAGLNLPIYLSAITTLVSVVGVILAITR